MLYDTAQSNSSPSTLNENELKMIAVLGKSVNKLTNSLFIAKTIKEIDGDHSILIGNNLNSLHLKVQNGASQFNPENVLDLVRLALVKQGYYHNGIETYSQLAYDAIQHRNALISEPNLRLDLDERTITSFAESLINSEWLDERIWDAVNIELQSFIEEIEIGE